MTDSVIVGAVSDLLVQMMDNAEQTLTDWPGLLPLTDGCILLGREHVAKWTAPSTVVFVPTNSSFVEVQNKSNWVTVTPPGTSEAIQPGRNARLLERPLGTDQAHYLVYCWGQSASETDRRHDFDVTRWLAHTVMRACVRSAMTSVRFSSGEGWIDQLPQGASMLSSGHCFSFVVTFDIPIVDGSVEFPPTPLTVVPSTPTFNTG